MLRRGHHTYPGINQIKGWPRIKLFHQIQIPANSWNLGSITQEFENAVNFEGLSGKKKLDKKYSLISNGEKVKFCYLKLPNPIHENVMSFIQEFPKELELNNYVDYDLQFEKSFLEPLKIILDAIGWNVEKTVNLELFFS